MLVIMYSYSNFSEQVRCIHFFPQQNHFLSNFHFFKFYILFMVDSFLFLKIYFANTSFKSQMQFYILPFIFFVRNFVDFVLFLYFFNFWFYAAQTLESYEAIHTNWGQFFEQNISHSTFASAITNKVFAFKNRSIKQKWFKQMLQAHQMFVSSQIVKVYSLNIIHTNHKAGTSNLNL